MRIVSATRRFFKDFIKNLHLPNFKNPFKFETPSKVSKSIIKFEAESLLKKFDLHENVHLSALDGTHVEVKNLNGEVHINTHAWHEISFELESGRIGKFCEKLSLRSSLSHADELSLRKVYFKDVPAKILADLEEGFVMHSKKFGDIGTTKLKNAEKALSPKSKGKIIKYITNAALTIGGVAIATGILFKDVVSEMHKAEGCFLYNGKDRKNCKLTDRSCAYPQTSDTTQPCNSNDFKQFFEIKLNTNLNLVIRKLLKDPDKRKELEDLKDALGRPNITVDNIEKIIENYYDKIIDFYNRNDKPTILQPCALFEESNKPICVACDSSAPINSYRYLDTTEVSFNFQSFCNNDPSVLKALNTTFGQSIEALLGGLGVGSFFGTFFQYIMYAIVGFILLCGVGYAVSFLRKKKGDDDDDEVSYSKLENEGD
ncbi:uncharacterized protein LOC130672712 [Microplitis mediator]|uniref:uncharacterized protein LOC130672712 n=1 Tax=Microplitis mediator TaxID=375433 RepID=UPI0025546F43|nr:uncharacterized protein LOC130672712 [Microplitis mediator]